MEQQEMMRMATEALKRSVSDMDIAINTGENEPAINIMGIVFPCIVWQNMTMGEATKLIDTEKRQTNANKLYVIGNATPKMQDWFVAEGVNFMDCAGNCNIRYKKRGKVVFAITNKGEKPVDLADNTLYPVFKEAGLKVVFYLLQDKGNVNQPYRTIKERTGVALGTVKNILGGMEAMELVRTDGDGRHLVNYGRLVNLWAMNYNQIMKPKLLQARMAFRSDDARNNWKNMALPTGMCWGQEPAAALADGYLNPGTFTIYTDVPAAYLMRTGSVQPDPNGEIFIYKKFWLQDAEEVVTPLVLTYADLIESGNARQIEAAERLKNWD